MDKNLICAIDKYLADHTNEIVDTLFGFVGIPSISRSDLAEPGAPFGKECRRMLDNAKKVFEDHGFKADVMSDGHYGLAEIGGKNGKTIGVFAHSDVVPTGDGWIYTDDPFKPVIKDGCMIGRGVDDNKSGLVMALYIPEILKAGGVELQSRYLVFVGSSEETGMDDIEFFTGDASQIMPDVCLVPDGSFPVCAGEKSICRYHAISTVPFKDIIEFEGGFAYNVVLDKINVKLRYSNALYADCIKIAEKGEVSVSADGDIINVKAVGVAKHAAMPDGGINAAHVFAENFKDCPSLCQSDRKLLSDVALLTGDFYAEKVGIAHEDFLGKLTFVNGMCRLEDDGRVNISVDIRHGCTLDSETLSEKIHAAMEKLCWNAEITEINTGYGYDRQSEFVKLLESVYNDCAVAAGQTGDESYYSAGGTYSRMLKNSYTIGTEAYYLPATRPEMPAGHGSFHQCDESMPINRFIEAIKIGALMVTELDKKLNM